MDRTAMPLIALKVSAPAVFQRFLPGYKVLSNKPSKTPYYESRILFIFYLFYYFYYSFYSMETWDTWPKLSWPSHL